MCLRNMLLNRRLMANKWKGMQLRIKIKQTNGTGLTNKRGGRWISIPFDSIPFHSIPFNSIESNSILNCVHFYCNNFSRIIAAFELKCTWMNTKLFNGFFVSVHWFTQFKIYKTKKISNNWLYSYVFQFFLFSPPPPQNWLAKRLRKSVHWNRFQYAKSTIQICNNKPLKTLSPHSFACCFMVASTT